MSERFELIVAARSADLTAFVEAMSRAYGTGPVVADWWRSRAGTVWSPPAVRR